MTSGQLSVHGRHGGHEPLTLPRGEPADPAPGIDARLAISRAAVAPPMPGSARTRPRASAAASSSRAKACARVSSPACSVPDLFRSPVSSRALRRPASRCSGVSAGATGFGRSAPFAAAAPRLTSPGSRPCCLLGLRCQLRPEQLSRRPDLRDEPSTSPATRAPAAGQREPAPWQGQARPAGPGIGYSSHRLQPSRGLSWLATLRPDTGNTRCRPGRNVSRGYGRWQKELVRAVGGVHAATVAGVVRTCVPEPDRSDYVAARRAAKTLALEQTLVALYVYACQRCGQCRTMSRSAAAGWCAAAWP